MAGGRRDDQNRKDRGPVVTPLTGAASQSVSRRISLAIDEKQRLSSVALAAKQ
jgi:hypothetical protein